MVSSFGLSTGRRAPVLKIGNGWKKTTGASVGSRAKPQELNRGKVLAGVRFGSAWEARD